MSNYNFLRHPELQNPSPTNSLSTATFSIGPNQFAVAKKSETKFLNYGGDKISHSAIACVPT